MTHSRPQLQGKTDLQLLSRHCFDGDIAGQIEGRQAFRPGAAVQQDVEERGEKRKREEEGPEKEAGPVDHGASSASRGVQQIDMVRERE